MDGREEQPLLVNLDEEVGNDNSPGDGRVTFVLIFSVFIAVCGSLVGGCAAGYTSPVQSMIIADLGLSTAEYSLFGSMLTVGGLLGSLVSGKITDSFGHRGTMGLINVFSLAGWLAISFSQGAWSLDLGRLALGLGSGLGAYVIPVYIAEITPKNLRGGLVLLYQFMICCGIALFYLVGLVTSWRILALIGTLPCLIQSVGLFCIPESPRWLVKIRPDNSYEAVLQRLRGENVDISEEVADIKRFTESAAKIIEDSFVNVFQRKYANALVISLGLMALAGFSGVYGVLYYATAIFESAGFSATIGTIAMAIIQLPPTLLGVFLTDKFGRRPLLLFSAAGMCIACTSMALSFLFKEHGWMTDYSPLLSLIGVLIVAATFPVGMGGVPFLIMSEIFPTSIKGAAGSLATIVCFSTAWIVSYAFNFMMDWSSSGTFFIFTGANVVCVLFIAKLVPETKGKTLEEIQELLAPCILH